MMIFGTHRIACVLERSERPYQFVFLTNKSLLSVLSPFSLIGKIRDRKLQPPRHVAPPNGYIWSLAGLKVLQNWSAYLPNIFC